MNKRIWGTGEDFRRHTFLALLRRADGSGAPHILLSGLGGRRHVQQAVQLRAAPVLNALSRIMGAATGYCANRAVIHQHLCTSTVIPISRGAPSTYVTSSHRTPTLIRSALQPIAVLCESCHHTRSPVVVSPYVSVVMSLQCASYPNLSAPGRTPPLPAPSWSLRPLYPASLYLYQPRISNSEP